MPAEDLWPLFASGIGMLLVAVVAQLGADAQPAALALVLACGDEAKEVRQWATSALENLGPPQAADSEPLTSHIEAKSPDVGYWAVTQLGRRKAPAATVVDALAVPLPKARGVGVLATANVARNGDDAVNRQKLHSSVTV